ncbi:MAG: glutamate racemase [Candidatus Gribaldobacteria bacterium]|nr:glutamate racemase [Candidatus Gribaldobacteria bacterium]
MPTKDGVIGVFDSGFGGLSILKEIVRSLPQYDYLYLGDTARTPYGTRSQEVIYQFTEQSVDFLFKRGCRLIILACNTASSEALAKIQQDYLPKHYFDCRVLGVLIPAAEQAVAKTKNNRVGVIATSGAVNSLAFIREIKKIKPSIQVFQNPAPLLVPLVEEGEHNSPMIDLAIAKYLKPLLQKNIDTLVLGCTHYGILEKKIKQIVGSKIAVISEGKVVAKKLADYLSRHPLIEQQLSRNGHLEFLTTDLTDKFQKLGSQFFGSDIKPRTIQLY